MGSTMKKRTYYNIQQKPKGKPERDSTTPIFKSKIYVCIPVEAFSVIKGILKATATNQSQVKTSYYSPNFMETEPTSITTPRSFWRALQLERNMAVQYL